MNVCARFALALLLMAACSTFVSAQTLRLKGTIDQVEGRTLHVTLSVGDKARLALAQDAAVIVVLRASLADIGPGTYLGSAALPQTDGTQRALEVRIFPESMRGVGEGHRPYSPVPQGTMTNGATVGAPVTGVNGSTLTVRYKDGEKQIVVPAGVPILRYVPGSLGDLRPGMKFTVNSAALRGDRSFEAGRINVGAEGVEPP